MSGELRNVFQEPEVLDKGSPRGLISAWSGGYFTDSNNGGFVNILGNSIANANIYLNPLGWWVCDGSEVNEPKSPIFNGSGRYLPNLTDDRFLMGGTSNGAIGGANTMLDHVHTHTISAVQATHRHYHDNASATTSSSGAHVHRVPTHNAGGSLWGAWGGGNANTTNYALDTNSAGAHTHILDIPAMYSDYQTPEITISGAVGTGSSAATTENRPKYLSCLYIIKVK